MKAFTLLFNSKLSHKDFEKILHFHAKEETGTPTDDINEMECALRAADEFQREYPNVVSAQSMFRESKEENNGDKGFGERDC